MYKILVLYFLLFVGCMAKEQEQKDCIFRIKYQLVTGDWKYENFILPCNSKFKIYTHNGSYYLITYYNVTNMFGDEVDKYNSTVVVGAVQYEIIKR